MNTLLRMPLTEILGALGPPADEGELLTDVKHLIKEASIGSEPLVAEDARSGMASYIELFFGPPSAALSLRLSLLGPFAALGGASFMLANEGEIGSFSQMTLGSVDVIPENLVSIADSLRRVLPREIRILDQGELATPLLAEFDGRIISSLQNIEGRDSPCVYDLVFQRED